MSKGSGNLKFTEEPIRLLKALAETKGVSQAAIPKIAIREAAKKAEIK
ncbi:MAG: hypothetical protein RBS35_12975 [Azonexus sp.]|jgi:hypothetical protein|nr:hypothetical protein [Azonexus sp.]